MDADDFGAQRDHEADAISQAAARWLARRDRGLSEAEKAELERWKAADPRHASELARMELTWREYDWAKSAPELLALVDEASRMSGAGSHRPASAGKPALAAAAAMAVLIAGLAWWNVSVPRKPEPITAATYRVVASAANRTILDDGSVVDVREGGEVQAEFTAAERRVRLVRGEAHFTVAPDATKPFVVQVGETMVRAVGTAFNVRLETGRVEVLVTEGKVQVADGAALQPASAQELPVVAAGQRAIVEREAFPVATAVAAGNIAVAPAEPGEKERALAWHSTRLVFDRTPLDEAVEAFNRHSESGSRVKLVIGDASLQTRRLGGTIRAANVDGFVRLLEQSVEVRTEQRGHEIVLLPAP